jgi:hypothetical protein
MAQAVSRRPLNAEVRFCAWISQCGICGGQIVTGTGFSPSSSVFHRVSVAKHDITNVSVPTHQIWLFVTFYVSYTSKVLEMQNI